MPSRTPKGDRGRRTGDVREMDEDERGEVESFIEDLP
jgi:hypothetical protein